MKIISRIISFIFVIVISASCCMFVSASVVLNENELQKYNKYAYHNLLVYRFPNSENHYKDRYKWDRKNNRLTLKGWRKIYNKGLYNKNKFRYKYEYIKYKATKTSEKKVVHIIKYKNIGRVKEFKVARYKFILHCNFKNTGVYDRDFYKIKKGKYINTYKDADDEKGKKFKYRISHDVQLEFKSGLEWTPLY